MAEAMTVITLVLILYFNLAVTYCVMLSDSFTAYQKLGALSICWLVPVIGPCVILYAVLDDIAQIKKRGWPLVNLLFLSWVIILSTGDHTDQCNDCQPIDNDQD
ncbi:hypothetical protein [Enterovibrio nigricans]|uniref:Uncharacterized protein n=1 Tax=Enterovibrio nigricans DSM 22720 TaxID=1121868 RepID=A0A1T4UBG0_9GAMM|nr:hypothetical protein [Enterovibrio nigricans]PKF51608.1 hypothetical protein AT251_02950 [Enterovibrio nigricans]SKA49920.1 hypothetical protein SAMN02745132_01266 [Enterovibrio nigricans DSM 22720]